MAKLSELQIDIVANTSDAEKALNNISKTAKEVGKGLETLATNLNGLNHQNLSLINSSLQHVRDMVASIGGATINITISPVKDQLNQVNKSVEEVTRRHWNIGIGARLNSDFDSATKQAKTQMDGIKDKQIAVDQTFNIIVGDVNDKKFTDWKTNYEAYLNELLDPEKRALVLKVAKVDDAALTGFKKAYTRYRNSLMDDSKLREPGTDNFEKAEAVLERLRKKGTAGVTPIYIKVTVDRTELDAFRKEIDTIRTGLSSPIDVNINVNNVQSAIDNGYYIVYINDVMEASGANLAAQVRNLIGNVEVTIKSIVPELINDDNIDDSVSMFITKVQDEVNQYFIEISTIKIAEDKDVIGEFIASINDAIKNKPITVAFKPDEASITEFVNRIRQEATSAANLNIGLDGKKANSITGALDKIAESIEKTADRISKASDMVNQIGQIGRLLDILEKHNLKDIGDGLKAFVSGVDALSKAKSVDKATFDVIIDIIARLDDAKMSSLATVLQPFGEALKAFGDNVKAVPGMGNKSFGWINDLLNSFDASTVSSLSQSLGVFSNGLTDFFNAVNNGAPKGQAINIAPFVKLITELNNASANIVALTPHLSEFGNALYETLTKLSGVSAPQTDFKTYSDLFTKLSGVNFTKIKDSIVDTGEKIKEGFALINEAVAQADTEKFKVFINLLKLLDSVKGGDSVSKLNGLADVLRVINEKVGGSKDLGNKLNPIIFLASMNAGNTEKMADAIMKLGNALFQFFVLLRAAPEVTEDKLDALYTMSGMDFSSFSGLGNAANGIANVMYEINEFRASLNKSGESMRNVQGHANSFSKTLKSAMSTAANAIRVLLTPAIKAAQLALKGLAEASKVPFKLISSGAKLAVEGMKKLISHFTMAGKSSISLGEKFTRLVASFWAIRRITWIFKRVFSWIKDSALSAMNFIESYHFFDVVTQNLGEKKYKQVLSETVQDTKDAINGIADTIKNNENLSKGVENIKEKLGSIWDSVTNSEAGKKIGAVLEVVADKSKKIVEDANSTKTKDRFKSIRKKTPKIDEVSGAAPTIAIDAVSSAASEFQVDAVSSAASALKTEVDAVSSAAPGLKKTSHELVETAENANKLGKSLKDNLTGRMGSARTQIKKATQGAESLEKVLKKDRLLKSATETGNRFRELEKTAKKLGKANEDVAKSYEKVTDKVSEATQKTKQYADEIKSNMLSLNEKMTGYTYDEEGNATSTGNKSLGMDADMLLQYQGTYAQMASGMGLAADEATTVSNALSMLAGDWSSLRNISFESSFQKMTQALAGQSRAVRSLGIDISQARLQQLLYDNGIDVSITKLNNAQKTELRMIAILEQSKVAYGDLAKTINTPANQLRMLEQNLKNLSRAFGNLFIPMLKTVLPYLNGVAIALTRIFQYIGSLMGVKISDSVTSSKDIDPYENIEESAEDAEESVTSLKRSVQGFDQLHILSNASSADMGDDIQDKLDDLLNADYDKYLDEWSKAFDEMKSKAQEIADKIMKAFKKLKEMLNYDDWGNFGEKLAEKINKWIEKLKELLDWENLRKIVEPWINRFTSFFNGLVDKIDWYNLGQAIGNGLNSWIHIITEILEGIDWVNLGKKLGEGLNGIIDAIDWDWVGRMLAAKLNAWIDTAFGFLQTFHWNDFGKDIGTALTNLIKNIHWGKLAADFALLFNGIFEAIDGFLDTFSFEDLGKTIADFMNAAIFFVDWKRCGTVFGRLFNEVFKGIRKWATEFKWNEFGKKIANFMTNAINAVDWAGVGATFRELFFGVFSAINGWFEEFNGVDENGEKGLTKIGKKLAEFANNLIDEKTMEEAGTAFSNAFNGIFEIGLAFIENFQWGPFTQALIAGVRTAIHGIDTKLVADTIRSVVRHLLGMFKEFVDSHLLEDLGREIGKVFAEIKLEDWVGWLQEAVDNIGKALHQLFDGLAQGLTGDNPDSFWGNFLKEFGESLEEITDLINGLIDALDKVLTKFGIFTGTDVSKDIQINYDENGNELDGVTGADPTLQTSRNKSTSGKAGGAVGAAAPYAIGGYMGISALSKLFGGGASTAAAGTAGSGLLSTLLSGLGLVGGTAAMGYEYYDAWKDKDKVKASNPILSYLQSGYFVNHGTDLDSQGRANDLTKKVNAITGNNDNDYPTAMKGIADTLKYNGITADEITKWYSDLGWWPKMSYGETGRNGIADITRYMGDNTLSQESLDKVGGLSQKQMLDFADRYKFSMDAEPFEQIRNSIKALPEGTEASDFFASLGISLQRLGVDTSKYGKDMYEEMTLVWGVIPSVANETVAKVNEITEKGVKSAVNYNAMNSRELATVSGEVTATYKGEQEAITKADHVARAHNDTVIQGKSNVADFGQTAVETFTDIGMVTETSAEKFSQLHIEASQPLPDNYSQYLTPLLTQLGVSKEGVKNLNAEIDSGKIPIQSVGDLYDVLMAKFGGTEENVSKINGIFSTYFGTEMPNSVNTTQGAIDGMSNALGNVPSKYEALEGAGTQAFGNVTTGTQDYDAILQKVQSRIADPSSFQSLGFNSEQANAYLRNELGLSEGEIATFWEAVKNNEAFDQFVKNDQTAMQEATRQVGLSDEAIKSMFGTVNDPTGFDNFQKFSSEANNFLRNEFGYSDEQIQAFWRGIANGSETSQELMGILVDVMAEHLGMMGVDVGELGKKFDTDLPQSVQTGVEEVTKSLESLTGDLGLGEDELGIEIFDPTGTMSVFEKAKISDVPYYKPLDKVKNALSSLTSDADKTKSNVIGSANEMVKGIEDKGKDFSDAGKSSGLSIESGMASAEPEIKKTASSLVNTAIGEAKTKSNEFATVGTNGISAMTAVMGKDTSLATATKTLTTEKMINTAHDVLTKDATGAPFLGREFDSKLAEGMNANSKALDDASRQAGNNIFAPFKEEAFITDTKKLGEDFDSNVGAGIDNNVDKAKTPAKNLKDGIVAEFDSVSSDIAGKFGDIGTAIQNTLNGVDMQSCVDILSSKFSGLPLAVANQFSNFSGETLVSLQNAGQAFATNFGNYVTSAMSTLKLPTPHYDVTSYNSVDNGNGGSINVPVFALNWYARGGFPRSGELFVANEAGPEMVGKMGSGTAVANNLQIIEGIAQGVASSLRSFVPYITEGTKDAVYGMKEFFSSMLPYITDSTVQTAVSLAEDLRQTLYEVAKSTRNDNYVAADRVEWCMRESFDNYRNYDASNTHQVADELSDRLIEGLYSVTRDTTDYIVDNLVDARGNGSADGKPYVMNINLMIDRDVVVRQVQEGILGQQDRMVNSY